jgi:hypothetical protein
MQDLVGLVRSVYRKGPGQNSQSLWLEDKRQSVQTSEFDVQTDHDMALYNLGRVIWLMALKLSLIPVNQLLATLLCGLLERDGSSN